MLRFLTGLLATCVAFNFIGGLVIQELPHCQERSSGAILVSTLDGNLSALNYSGDLLWEIQTGPGPLLVSNIHNLELTNNGKMIRIIPSLSGTLYKFDGTTLDPIPITAEGLLKSSFKYSEDLVIAGGYEIRTYGVGFDSGKIIHECSPHKCSSEPSTSTEDILLVERKTQTIRAVDPKRGHERWNFSVALHTIRLPNVSCLNTQHVPDLNISVNMPTGILTATLKDLKWQYQFPSPIVNVWKWDGRNLVEIDVFASKESPSIFASTVNPAVYIAMYKTQLYIQESVIMQNKLSSKSSNDVVVVEANSLIKIPWNPIAANNMKENDTALAVLNGSPQVEGSGYFLYTEQNKSNLLCKKNTTFRRIIERIDFERGFIVEFILPWWKELGLIIITILTMNLMWCFRFKKNNKNTEIVYVPIERRISERESESETFYSRYVKDFDTIKCLGKGGFGVVFEVRKKIDECSYAIKRITLPNNKNKRERVLREVKALAKLEHINIVRYFNSWLETPPMGWLEEHDKEFTPADVTETLSTYTSRNESPRKKATSLSISFQESHSFQQCEEDDDDDDSFIVFEDENICDATTEELPVDVTQTSNSTQSVDIESITPHQERKINWKRPDRKHHSWDSNIFNSIELEPPTFLYIQMQLCHEHSLKEWLFQQNNRDYQKSLDIFQQILNAVEYVHMKGLIHRDLKPGNIFFALDGQIKVGDFGLVKDMEDNLEAESKKDNSLSLYGHTKEVGTQLYMSPEQFQSRNYDYKVDIYSLGLILLELLVPFSTDMERINTLTNAKKGTFPDSFATEYPNEHSILKEMLCKDPRKRLTTIGIRAKAPFNVTSCYGDEYHYNLPNIQKN